MDTAVAIDATIILGWVFLMLLGIVVVSRFLSWLNDGHPTLTLTVVLAGTVAIVWYVIYLLLLGA